MAQEREKRRIVIASILKPVDDTRMFEKMGCGLSNRGFDVSIIGFGIASVSGVAGIRFIPLGTFRRLSFRRWWTKWSVLLEALKIKPDVFIFTTHELLVPAIVLKVILNTKIIYDVRENYFRNIRHSESLPRILRFLLAVLVRLKEKLTAPACDHFFLAERGYEKEFNFYRGGWTVLENKALGVLHLRGAGHPNRERGTIQLLFSGTLAENTGVFRAIQLAKGLHEIDQNVRLTIAGYAATRHVRAHIRKETDSIAFIKLVGIERLVPHTDIVTLIHESDAGIIAYAANPTTRNSIPTKLFEYLHAGLPIIVESHWPWIERYSQCEPFAIYDFSHPDPGSLLNTLTTKQFYLTRPTDTGWQSEEAKLHEAIKNIV